MWLHWHTLYRAGWNATIPIRKGTFGYLFHNSKGCLILQQQTVLFDLQCYSKTTTVTQACSHSTGHFAKGFTLYTQELKDHRLLDFWDAGDTQFQPDVPSEMRGPSSPSSTVTPAFPQHPPDPLRALTLSYHLTHPIKRSWPKKPATILAFLWAMPVGTRTLGQKHKIFPLAVTSMRPTAFWEAFSCIMPLRKL